jgi:hypothetical protein
LLGFTVAVLPAWAAAKEKVKQKKPTSEKWQKKRLRDYTR